LSTAAYYPTAPALWLTEAVLRNTGYSVEVNPLLEASVAVDRHRGLIEIRPGLTFPRFHLSLSRAALFTVFDETVVPEFRHAQPLPEGVTRLHSALVNGLKLPCSLSS
jgi:hypothetical protein